MNAALKSCVREEPLALLLPALSQRPSVPEFSSVSVGGVKKSANIGE